MSLHSTFLTTWCLLSSLGDGP